MIVFKDWQDKIVRPVLVNLTTAFLLFLASLSFAPVRSWLFPAETIRDYPLISTAEPSVSKADNRLIVEFFVINRTDHPYTREELVRFLHSNNPDARSKPSPDIELAYWRKVGKIEDVFVDKEFNDQKGTLDVVFQPGSDRIVIKVVNIKARAVMKVSVVIVGLPEVGSASISRMAKDAVPLLYEDYQDACYMRDSK
jgi:hypothetical protein